MRQFDMAIEQSKKTLEIDANFASAHGTLARSYLWSGDFGRALEEWEKAARLTEDNEDLAQLNAVKSEYQRSGVRGAKKRAAELTEEQARHHYVDPGLVAVGWAEAGENERAFRWLEKAYAEKSNF